MAAQPRAGAPSGGSRPPAPSTSLATGGVAFAGVLLLLNGIMAIFQGISAIAVDDVYARFGSYIYKINLTGWGWILLVLGVIAAAAGWGVLVGAAWARVAGIVMASLSLLAQFLFLPYSPVWSVIMVALDVFVIWALTTYEPGTPAT
ncbi:hypothetical protein JK361_02530 [Streptomyces sp. 5-8]|uniref:DUF7144 domain-containing protein n=1 Tax=Streptomyces musisoli TaxID=2802280 RepID=A0ABS1NTR8_9ACTN|nr:MULTISPECIES: hypothetical protein [Streptomyces]MBL1103489.1 hypothetical protein [Streptomyces musisoli]MBY8839905.1 hypothetical protein [Streptomyces sp. SP2-10]